MQQRISQLPYIYLPAVMIVKRSKRIDQLRLRRQRREQSRQRRKERRQRQRLRRPGREELRRRRRGCVLACSCVSAGPARGVVKVCKKNCQNWNSSCYRGS